MKRLTALGYTALNLVSSTHDVFGCDKCLLRLIKHSDCYRVLQRWMADTSGRNTALEKIISFVNYLF